MQPELEKLAADIVDGLLQDLGATFPHVGTAIRVIDADVYGWKVARAEALADRLKSLLVPAMSSGELLKIMTAARNDSLRDAFAEQALALHERFFDKDPVERLGGRETRRLVAVSCYLMADAMLRARNPEPQPAIVEVADGELTEVEAFDSNPFVINARKVLAEISRPLGLGETHHSRLCALRVMANKLFPF